MAVEPHLQRSTQMNSDATPAADTAAEQFEALALSASLTVKDIERSRAWYRAVLGFKVDREMEREGKLRSVAVSAGAVRILLNQDDAAKGPDRKFGEGFSLMIATVQSVDAIADRIKAAGGTLVSEPADTPWGMRVFRVTDPDGYKFAISKMLQPVNS